MSAHDTQQKPMVQLQGDTFHCLGGMVLWLGAQPSEKPAMHFRNLRAACCN